MRVHGKLIAPEGNLIGGYSDVICLVREDAAGLGGRAMTHTQTDKRNVAQTVRHAETMAQVAWSCKARKSNPWLTADVRNFVRSMDRAGYVFEEHEYPIDGCFIESRWEQLAQWAESIAQNERDTERGI